MRQLSIQFFFAGLLAVLFAACGSATKGQDSLTGSWVTADSSSLVLGEGGKGKFNNTDISYTVKDNTLSITQGGATSGYAYKLSGDELEVSGADLKTPMKFTRRGDRGILSRASAENVS